MSFLPPLPSVAEPSRPAGTGPVWNTAAAVGVGALVTAYIAAAVDQIFWMGQAAADATTLGTLIGSPSVDALDTFHTTLDAHITAMHTTSALYQAAFWAMFIAFFGWQAILRSRLRAMGRTFDRRSTTAWQVWRVGLIISIVMIIVVQAGAAPTTPDAIASNYHKLMAYYTVRALVGVTYLWVVFTVWRSARAEFATVPALSVGLPPVAGLPAIPTGYPPAPQGYQPAFQPPNPYEPSPWSAPAPPAAETRQA